MNKQYVQWKTVKARNIRGADYETTLPALIDIGYKGRLLPQILQMKSQKPIGFDDAIRKVHGVYSASLLGGRIGNNPGETRWYFNNFVEWIANQGYHIELTGDEFEAACLTDKLS